MSLTYDDLPALRQPEANRRARPKPVNRRDLLRRGAAVGAVLGLSYLTLVPGRKAWAGDDGYYFREWTDNHGGPCAPGGYASMHTEHGVRCGPSTPCNDQSCCWTGTGTPSAYARANTRNATGWFAYKPAAPGAIGYTQRPDECFSSTSGSDYDSWRWKFSDGKIYRCSDGFKYSAGGSVYKSICPWPV